MSAVPSATRAPDRPLVVAHRGNASVAPGNTMPAVEGAWRAGADLVEVDVRMSADGVPVVIHDATVDATTTGAGEVAGMTGAQARELDAGSWFSPVFAAHRVPLLADVARFLSDHDGTDLLLEVKGDLTVVQATVVLATLDAAGMRERTIVQTFWPQTIRALRAVDPAMRLGLLVGSHVAPNEVMFLLSAEVGAMACNPRYDLLAEDPNLVQAIHDAGMRVFVWTLNEAAAWEEAVAWGVDGIITDRPDRLAGWLSARGVERSAPEAV
ncbi:glycerophosphoryl diester phosphodiesterase [Ruania alba]|uniref:Glycerophosphoryl diester phosphodiesterase n=1 Tax=Ruania alba TaxID=648782 RepID=A0A1H5L9U4_9MICO|nr:glycerophosphoryl diester phosphodiesterase [Ruania alba]